MTELAISERAVPTQEQSGELGRSPLSNVPREIRIVEFLEVNKLRDDPISCLTVLRNFMFPGILVHPCPDRRREVEKDNHSPINFVE